jgi:hypothetical protein
VTAKKKAATTSIERIASIDLNKSMNEVQSVDKGKKRLPSSFEIANEMNDSHVSEIKRRKL